MEVLKKNPKTITELNEMLKEISSATDLDLVTSTVFGTSDYQNILEKFKQDKVSMTTPYGSLEKDFSMFALKKYIPLGTTLMLVPFLIIIVLLVYGIAIKNYYLFFSILLFFIIPVLTSPLIWRNIKLFVIPLILGALMLSLLYNWAEIKYITIAIFLLIDTSIRSEKYMQNTLIKMALESDYFFWYLWKKGTLIITNKENGQQI